MKRSFLFLLISAWLISGCSSTGGVGAGWQVLGEQSVNLIIDHDELTLGNTGDALRKIRLKVIDGPVHIINIRIHFDTGGVQNVPVNTTLKTGQQSKVIDLEGGLRNIRKIGFWYNTVGLFNGKSRVAVLGSK